MKVIVTEKPSVARDIAKVLKVNNKHEGYFSGNGYNITWAFGHLVQLIDPDKYDKKFKRWSFQNLPIVPETFKREVSKQDGSKKQYSVIKKLITDKNAEEIICATDAGREGELIFRLIYDQAKCKKPIKRLWISSQTDSAILEGFNNLKPGENYQPLYDSAVSRAEADWLIGMNGTRAYTIKFSQGAGVMSVGRVQTPVLKMIVDRHKEHTAFKPETFYEIVMDIAHENGGYLGKWINEKKETRLSSNEAADDIVNTLKNNPTGTVKKVSTKEKKEKQPLLYDLTTLQRDANKQFRYSADRTLKITQRLYETHKVLTYPRTSSRYLSQDMGPKLPQLIENLKNNPQFEPISTKLGQAALPITKRIIDDTKVTDHHAIIPTDKVANVAELGDDERKIYDLVIKRFLSVFLPQCIKDHTEIISLFGEHQFRSSGTVIKQLGWREPYQNDKKEAEDEKPKKDAETLLPKVSENDPLKQIETKKEEGQTKPPALYNEASILAAMETAGKDIEDDEIKAAMKDIGLGTPATRASILERLISVGYITREKNRLIPTEKGIDFISFIQNPKLVSPEMTGDWEKKLNEMAQNKYKREDYMEEIVNFTKEVVENVMAAEGGDDVAENALVGECPKCNAEVREGKMAFNCEKQQDKQCDFVIWKTIAGKKITQKVAKQLLTDKKTELLENFKSKTGKSFNAHLIVKDDNKVGFEFSNEPQEPIGKCTMCEDGEITPNSKAYSCSNWKNGCKFVIWRNVASRPISTEEAKMLMEEGKTPKLKGFKSRAGKFFDAILEFKEGKVSFVFDK